MRVCAGSVLLLGCPGIDKGDTEGSTGPATGGDASSSMGASEGSEGSTSASTGQAPGDSCAQYMAADLADTQSFCTCAVEVGEYPAVEACVVENTNAEEADCLCQVGAMGPEHAQYVVCLAEAVAGYAACVEPLSCEEKVGLGPMEEACFEAFLAANHVCDRLSIEAVLADEACLEYGPPFKCGSGESIPNSYVCDGDNDCADSSDEALDLCLP